MTEILLIITLVILILVLIEAIALFAMSLNSLIKENKRISTKTKNM